MSKKQQLCLNIATIRGCSIFEQVKAAAAAGFDGIGLWADDVRRAVRQGTPLMKISESIKSAGLNVPEVCFIGGWQDSEGIELESALSRAKDCFELAGSLRCDLVIAVAAAGKINWEMGVRNFRRLCELAKEYGVRIAVEAAGTTEEMKDVLTVLKLVEDANCPNAGMVLDTFHFHVGGSSIEDILCIPKEKLFLVHISDPEDVAPELWRIKHDHRTLPFYGILNFVPIMANLKRIGYEGWFSLEVFNSRFREEEAAKIAKDGIESIRRLFI